jgi:antitoxin (DNA-binding transcriptional repressor) of toxin-antitoxin stability system
METVDAVEFELQCLELIDQVETTGASFEIAKGGKPYVRLVPVDASTMAEFESDKKRSMRQSRKR